MLNIREHNAGFFSCVSVRLDTILNYYNENKKCPLKVDSSKLFNLYKINRNDDITNYLFETDDMDIPYDGNVTISKNNEEYQFTSYSLLNYNELKPFIDKYFKPTRVILDNKLNLINKYNIDVNNTCSVFFRGNDKARETNTPSYNDFIEKAQEIKQSNPNINFLLQTDEIEFCNAFKSCFPETIVFCEIPQIHKSDSSVQYSLNGQPAFKALMYYFASVLVMADTKYIISTSGNGELWVQLFRQNPNGLIQYLNRKEYIYGVKNKDYVEGDNNFWIIHSDK
jgi:hypothetical protein